jgi:hypothetical protein
VSCPAVNRCFAVGVLTGLDEAFAFIEAWNGKQWKLVVPAEPDPWDNELNSVSCTSVSNCFAVGNRGIHTWVLHWDGARWTTMRTPSPPVGARLARVSCSSASFCMAVGFRDVINPYRPFAMRWNGKDWSIVPTPMPSTGATFDGVDCWSATACTAVGSGDTGGSRTVAERWDGVRWTLESTANLPGRDNNGLTDVECRGPRDCFAVGLAWFPSATLVERST